MGNEGGVMRYRVIRDEKTKEFGIRDSEADLMDFLETIHRVLTDEARHLGNNRKRLDSLVLLPIS